MEGASPTLHSEPPFGLYLVVTDPVTSYEAVAEAAVRAGLRFLQLRMKRTARETVLATAKAVRAITRGSRTIFIVNDDPALAVEAEADGVHLGQGDMPLPEARARFPELRIFGLSTHSYAQMEAAKAVRPDYAGVGPVYATPTKAIPDPTLGPAEAGRIVQASPWPTVAIGGPSAVTPPPTTPSADFRICGTPCAPSRARDAATQRKKKRAVPVAGGGVFCGLGPPAPRCSVSRGEIRSASERGTARHGRGLAVKGCASVRAAKSGATTGAAVARPGRHTPAWVAFS